MGEGGQGFLGTTQAALLKLKRCPQPLMQLVGGVSGRVEPGEGAVEPGQERGAEEPAAEVSAGRLAGGALTI